MDFAVNNTIFFCCHGNEAIFVVSEAYTQNPVNISRPNLLDAYWTGSQALPFAVDSIQLNIIVLLSRYFTTTLKWYLSIMSRGYVRMTHFVEYLSFTKGSVFISPGRRQWELMVWCSVRRQLFPLNDFSRTTRLISSKLGRKHAWGMEIQVCSNKGAGPFWGPIRGKVRKILINLFHHVHHRKL